MSPELEEKFQWYKEDYLETPAAVRQRLAMLESLLAEDR